MKQKDNHTEDYNPISYKRNNIITLLHAAQVSTKYTSDKNQKADFNKAIISLPKYIDDKWGEITNNAIYKFKQKNNNQEPNEAELKETIKSLLPTFTITQSGQRLAKDHPDFFKEWNGWIFCDLDHVNDRDESLVYNILNAIWDKMLDTYMLCAAQLSYSKNGIHFIFRVKPQYLTAEEYYGCAAFVYTALLKATQSVLDEHPEWFYNKSINGVPTIDKIIDQHNFGHYQLLFISRHKPKVNEEYDLDLSTYYIDTKSVDTLYKKGKSMLGELLIDTKNQKIKSFITTMERYCEDDIKSNADKDRYSIVESELPIDFKIREYSKNGYYNVRWTYNTRHHLRSTIFKSFGYNEQTKNLVVEIALKNCDSDHTYNDLMAECNIFDVSTLEYYNPPLFIINELRENYGIKIETEYTTGNIKPQKIDLVDFDEVKTIKQNEYLSAVLDDIIDNKKYKSIKNIEIVANCGYGKTTAIKKLNGDIMNLNWILNGGWKRFNEYDEYNESIKNNKRICFITPLKSINKDSFEVKDNDQKDDKSNKQSFLIIDSDHKIDNDKIINNNKSICTTWDSFVYRNLNEIDFDIIVIDEIHTFYMYDYRVESITYLKDVLKKNVKCNKLIFLTGTPSYEIFEFNPYMIKVQRENEKLNNKADIIVYDKQYFGHLQHLIDNWQSKSNDDMTYNVAIFNDTANEDFKDNLARHGIYVNNMYNKANTDLQNELLTTNTISNGVSILSVYNQVGINIKTKNKKQKFLVVILNTIAVNIIQYANRFRDKDDVEKIVVYLQRDSINNYKEEYNMLTYDLEKQQALVNIDKYNIDNNLPTNNDIFNIKTQNLFTINKHHLNLCYMDKINGKYELNHNRYNTYWHIIMVQRYERQFQVIYNRLIDSGYKVKIDELDEDVKSINEKVTNNFCRYIQRMIVRNEYNIDKYDNIIVEKNTTINDNMKEKLEHVLTWVYKNSNKDLSTMQSWLIRMEKMLMDSNNTITTTDIKQLSKLINIMNQYQYMIQDGMVKIIIDNDDLFKVASEYVVFYAPNSVVNSKHDLELYAEDVYQNIKAYKTMFDKYNWVIKEQGVKFDSKISDTVDNRNVALYNDDKKEDVINKNKKLYATVYNYLYEHHTRGKIGGKIGGKSGHSVTYKGVTYKTVTEMASKLGVTRCTAYKWLKNK